MTIVRGETIGVTIYDRFPRWQTVANGAIQIVFGVILIALSFPSQMRLWVCQKAGEHRTDEFAPGVDASLWVWIFKKCIVYNNTAVIGVFYFIMQHPCSNWLRHVYDFILYIECRLIYENA
jgi:hypothetical protein